MRLGSNLGGGPQEVYSVAKNRAVNKQDDKKPPRAESERNEHAQFGPPWAGWHT